MDYFEEIACKLLEEEGYWIRRSFKVELTPIEKKSIGKPNTPRPEIDILAMNFDKNIVVIVEAKSFLDSLGVDYEELSKKHEISEGRYKIFTCENYRRVVIKKLSEQLINNGMANAKTTFILGLVVAGKVKKGKDKEIRELFKEQNWLFWSPSDVKKMVERLAEMGYENHPAVITAKILLRK